MKKAIQQYLQQYAEPEALLPVEYFRHRRNHPLSEAPTRFQHVLVIPAYRETEEFIIRFRRSALAQQAVLLIVVINQPDTDEDVEANRTLWRTLTSEGICRWQSGCMSLIAWPEARCQLLLVERFEGSRRIPHKQGVGLARKIGADLAVSLIQQGVITSRWINSSDADAALAADYFLSLPDSEGYSAAIYPFVHQCDESSIVGRATRLYERALNYYVAGLAWAGSPYAFHTIGSALAVDVDRYCQARGFPKRAGGEDFYLLNKLAKLAPVYHPRGTPVRVQARMSDRVPFGTGPAVQKIIERQAVGLDYEFYHPNIFVALKAWLQALSQLWVARGESRGWFEHLPAATQAGLQYVGIEQLLRHIQNQVKTSAQCEYHVQSWFDAFRTLKFVHFLEQRFYPAISLDEAEALFAQISTTPAYSLP